MRALLIVAHGSRRAESNEEVKSLTDQLRIRIEALPQADFGFVDCAFLELAEPSIEDGMHDCVGKGAREVVILPYFLSAGRHVAQDIPAIVEQVAATLPAVKIRIAPYLGSSAGLSNLMLELAK
ncbi:Sirohydrochlorin cobaltochelatase [hydrothermal vent metagenome]|uniref:Sirohydrochlorin cobaltochelatase n=1 Tax=hydrothermal vent metagenome TaxID=652676 RepID=A0A3B1A969_9ZZZZ